MIFLQFVSDHPGWSTLWLGMICFTVIAVIDSFNMFKAKK